MSPFRGFFPLYCTTVGRLPVTTTPNPHVFISLEALYPIIDSLSNCDHSFKHIYCIAHHSCKGRRIVHRGDKFRSYQLQKEDRLVSIMVYSDQRVYSCVMSPSFYYISN